MADSGQQLIEKALGSVEDRIQQQIEAARQRRERERQQRAELAEARAAGLAARRCAKLQRQAEDAPPNNATTPPDAYQYNPCAREGDEEVPSVSSDSHPG
ncbi:hypothetical protein ACIF80_09595 [Streptomyces sp. NPDC085927]|uniref:hypothetical protein n=1 Tax=Streptomyces sp. NPDC085927 TaxID=3365738 RepID=UPI0037D61EB2